jgi:acetyl-CoA synthetase
MKWGAEEPAKHDLSSLRVLGTVGEPINPEAWMWYHEHIGGGRCPIVDTWWQTETGGIMISPAARGHHHQARVGHVPAARGRRRGGRRRGQPSVERAAATSRSPEPWPSMLRGIWGDPERYRDTYWSPLRGAATSPATAPSSTTTATSGCSAASTT